MSRLFLLILGIGIALICLGFFTLVEVHPWTNQVWLDLFVVISVFSFNFFDFTYIGQDKSTFRYRIPSRGILWTACSFYSVLSIGALFRAHIMNWSFSLSLIVQLTLAFGVLIALSLAHIANQHVQDVQQTESIAVSSLDKLRETFNNGVGATTRITSSDPDIKKLIDKINESIKKIGEDIRYLSALSGAEASQLDTEIGSEIQVLFSSLGRAKAEDLGLQKTGIEDSFDRIKELIRKRKNCKDNSDLKEMFS